MAVEGYSMLKSAKHAGQEALAGRMLVLLVGAVFMYQLTRCENCKEKTNSAFTNEKQF